MDLDQEAKKVTDPTDPDREHRKKKKVFRPKIFCGSPLPDGGEEEQASGRPLLAVNEDV
jgi:hypothetical protein